MIIPDPPWKKKTRPCPFYSQGRCVFTESCGFLHDVKVKGSADQHVASVSLDAKSSQGSISSMDSVVKAPLTIAVHSPTSPSSPARSPRMANLLSALQGIIGPDHSEITELTASEGEEPLCDRSDASHLLRGAVNGTWGVDDENVKHLLGDSPPQTSADIVESVNDTSPAGDTDDERKKLLSPPGLLSPVQIGTVPPVPFPHAALAFDSDSPEAWIGPTPFSLSPPHLSQPGPTLNFLSFPFCSPVSPVLSRRLSSSASWKQSSLPTLRDSSLMPTSQAWHSLLDSFTPEQKEVEDAISSNGMANESDLSIDVSNTERPLVSLSSSDIPGLRSPTPMTSYENSPDTQFAIMTIPDEDSFGDREEYLPTVPESSPVPSQLSSMGVEANHPVEPLHHPTPTVDIKATSTHSASVSEHSPVSPRATAEATDFDYEALYQSLVMSPEEAASKRLSWVSRSSPPRASSVGTLSVPGSMVARADALRRSHSADLPRSHVALPLLSENTSRTSSPLLETPVSSGSSQADASTQSIQVARTSPAALSTTSLVASTSPLISSKQTPLPAEKLPLQSSPIAGPSSGEVKSLLNGPPRSIWNSVSTSRKVPFGFRNSISSEKGPLVGSRKRPSVLSLTPVSLIDRFETPGSASSFSSESSQSKPSWARPLHLSQPSEAGPPVHRSSSYRDSLASFTDPLHPQHFSPSSSHSSHSPPHVQIHNEPHSTNHISSVLTHNSSISASLPDAKTWHDSVHLNPESHDEDRRPEIRPIPNDANASENGDQLLTFTLGPIPLPSAPPTLQRESSLFDSAPSSATTPERSLIFAIASDDADSVRRVLEHSHADPNESIGPQSALAFALTNERLAHKLDIVKALLAHGANPAALRNPELNPPHRDIAAADDTMLLSPPPTTTLEAMDPATRYYVSRADAPQTRHLSTLLQRSLFRPLGRARYDIVGQDRVFEQLFTVLNQHSRTLSVSPLVLLLCGPSGHGKSLLARRFGSLLGVPTHTVNVTTLQSTHDIWDSYSMSPYEELSARTLSQFLLENEGKRCVVVLDEIEKVDEPRVLFSLLMPWELGRCSPKTGHRPIDVRQVVWLGTSNIGHDLVFEFCSTLPGASMSPEEYVELVRLLRPKVSQCLGASLVSRVTAVLPFVPFTEAELMAIATEVFYSLGSERTLSVSVSSDVVERIARRAIESYIPEEGARSLHRAISYLLTDVPELSST